MTVVLALKFETTILNVSEAELAKLLPCGSNLMLVKPGLPFVPVQDTLYGPRVP
jgi:hypothetical protein